jgi:hypothetical protein
LAIKSTETPVSALIHSSLFSFIIVQIRSAKNLQIQIIVGGFFKGTVSSLCFYYRCEVCEMSIYGVRNLSAHYNGKKHLKNMADGGVSIVSDPYSFDTDPEF